MNKNTISIATEFTPNSKRSNDVSIPTLNQTRPRVIFT